MDFDLACGAMSMTQSADIVSPCRSFTLDEAVQARYLRPSSFWYAFRAPVKILKIGALGWV